MVPLHLVSSSLCKWDYAFDSSLDVSTKTYHGHIFGEQFTQKPRLALPDDIDQIWTEGVPVLVQETYEYGKDSKAKRESTYTHSLTLSVESHRRSTSRIVEHGSSEMPHAKGACCGFLRRNVQLVLLVLCVQLLQHRVVRALNQDKRKVKIAQPYRRALG